MKKTKKQPMPAYHIAGWYGSFAIILAYILVSFGFTNSKELLYQLLNLSGAASLFYLAYKNRVKETMFLNGFWCVIAVFSIFNVVSKV